MGLLERRTQDALIRLSLSSDNLTRALDIGNTAFRENVALNKEAAIFFEALASKMKTLRNVFTNAAAILGKAFGPVILEIIDTLSAFGLKLQDFAKRMADLPIATKKWIVTLLAALIALGPLLIGLGSFVLIIGAGAGVLGNFIKVMGKLKPAIRALKFTALFTNPFGLAVLAIGLVIAALFKFRNEMITVGENSARVRDFILVVWDEILIAITFVANGIVAVWDKAVLLVGLIWQDLTGVVLAEADTIKLIFKSVGNAVIQSFQIAGLFVTSVFKIMFGVVNKFVEATVDVFFNLLDAFELLKAGKFTEALDAVFGADAKVVNPFEDVPGQFKTALADARAIMTADPIGDVADAWAEKASSRMARTMKAKIKMEAPASEGLKADLKVASEVVKKAGPELGTAFNDLFIKGMQNALAEFAKEAKDVAQLTEDAFKNAFDTIETSLLDFIETGKFNFKDFAQSIMREFNKIVIKSILGDLALKLQGKDSEPGGFLAGIAGLFGGGSGSGGAGAFGVSGGQIGPAEAGFGQAGGLIGPAEASKGTSGVIMAVTDGTAKIGEFFRGLGTKFTDNLKNLGGLFMDGLKGLGTLLTAGAEGAGSVIKGILGVLSAAGAEGGISDQLLGTKRVPLAAFANAKKFAQGGVTSGSDRIPALLSRNEAVVPLSRNRAIPVEGMSGGTTNITFNIETRDAESFKQSRSQMLARLGLDVARARRRTQ